MINGYWGYNPKENKYEPMKYEPFSLFPTVVEPKKKVVYCRQCHRWENILHFDKNILTTQCGKKYCGPFVLENSMVNYSYNIQKKENSYFLDIKSQIAANNARRLFDSNYFIDMKNKVLYRDGKSVFEKDEISNVLCKELTDQITSDMGNLYKEKYGIIPTISTSLKGFNRIIGYMLSPFNVNFFKIAQHWGLNPYDKNFSSLSSGDTPTAENEMFESLGIKPTKYLRKKYQAFPQSVVCYAAAQDLGFTDVNILQKSISSHFYAFLKYCMISFAGGEITYSVRDGLKDFVSDLLELSTQKTVWNSIERTLESITDKNTHDYLVTDGIQTYGHVRRHLTDNEKKEIMREGFNQYTHDFLVRRATHFQTQNNSFSLYLNSENVKFEIEEEFLKLEYKAGDSKKKIKNSKTGEYEFVDVPDEERYCFYVARDTNTLREIGSAMHNCVGWGYGNSVMQRRATIVYAKFRNQYRICIEVTPDFSIRQSLGICNSPLEGSDLEAYHEWCAENNIKFTKAFFIHCAP